jgi:hypothetical protein
LFSLSRRFSLWFSLSLKVKLFSGQFSRSKWVIIL